MGMRKILPGKCLTTAMGIMPHSSMEDAMKIALSLDVPYWPQLPRYSYYEDMYVQSSEGFPGLHLNVEEERITVDLNDFYEALPAYLEASADPAFFELSPQYSHTFAAFLEHDLSRYPAIRGQSVGPVSFGFKIFDQDKKPIIYHDELRGFMFEFMAQKANAQYRQLVEKNPLAFVWMDEPGLQMLFASFTGYTATAAKEDYLAYLSQIEGPKGIHLCGNPDWSFLLEDLDLDILSMDSYSVGHIFTRYKTQVIDFIKRGAIIAWGITPTLTEELNTENLKSLAKKLEEMFEYIAANGLEMDEIIDRAWLAPSRCCLVNADKTASVEKSFEILKALGEYFKEEYKLF